MSALPSPADFTAPLRCAGPALRTQRDARRKIEEQELSTLMRFAQSGDRAAYTRLVRRIMPLLQRALRTRHGFLQAADRDDLMQDVLLSVHRAMATYDSRREFIPWLMAIARNKMADRARRFARSGAHEILVDDLAETSPATPSAPDLASRGDVEALRRAICRLSDGQRTAIELVKIRELTSQEAARVMGTTPGALRVSVHRAVKTLRASLGEAEAIRHAV
jgi:RNA polymerase sigma factor (sigma-70 family)